MTLRSAQQNTIAALCRLYDEREAANITDWALEHITGQRRVDRLLIINQPMPTAWENELTRITAELLAHKPVQYVLQEAWFAGMQFHVDEQVLIPRPETEELVAWIADTFRHSNRPVSLLDIGTGSGCIPVALKKLVPQFDATGIDISEGAIQVAEKNAGKLQAEVQFLLIDFLAEKDWLQLPAYDVIVSNPPYIRRSESGEMRRNVLDYEPHLALFVPDNDPLLFYRKLIGFAETHLNKGGSIFLEINEALGDETEALYTEAGYQTELRKDMQGKHRMLRARKAQR